MNSFCQIISSEYNWESVSMRFETLFFKFKKAYFVGQYTRINHFGIELFNQQLGLGLYLGRLKGEYIWYIFQDWEGDLKKFQWPVLWAKSLKHCEGSC